MAPKIGRASLNYAKIPLWFDGQRAMTRWSLLLAAALVTAADAGCIAGKSDVPRLGPEASPPSDVWNWSLPNASGTLTARISVLTESGPLTLVIDADLHLPNKNGELFETEAHWQGGATVASFGSWGVPGDDRLYVRAEGQEVVPGQDLPDLPSIESGPLHQSFTIAASASNRPSTLVVSVAAVRDGAQTKPLAMSLHLQASKAALSIHEERFTTEGVRAFFLGSGGFDGPAGTRIRVGVTDVAITTRTFSFETKENTFIWAYGRLEGTSQVGVGSLQVDIKGGREAYSASRGVQGGDFLHLAFIRTYGDAWSVNASFMGEGYLVLAYADLPINPPQHAPG